MQADRFLVRGRDRRAVCVWLVVWVNDICQLSVCDVYISLWLWLREDQVEFVDGLVGAYAVLLWSDFVAVVLFENDGFWLVEQFWYLLG